MTTRIDIVQPSPSVYDAAVGAEVVLFDEKSGDYFTLNVVAARVWKLVGQGLSVIDIVTVLEGEFAVDAVRLAEDVGTFISEMESKGLLQVGDAG